MRLSISSEDMRQELQKEQENRPQATPPDIGIFTGFGYEAPKSIARAGTKTLAPFLSYDEEALKNQYGIFSHSDPNTMGIAAHLVEGLSDTAPYWAVAWVAGKVLSWIPTPPTKAVGLAIKLLPYVAAGLYGGVSKKKESSLLHQYQGVEKSTADTLGTYEAATLTGALALPPSLPFKSLLGRGLSGGGINIAVGAIDRAIASHVLERDGYHEMAEHYKVFDKESILLDGMIGTFFGLIHTKEGADFAKSLKGKMGEVLGDLKDGITDRLIYKHAVKSSSPHLHTSYEAHKAHMDTLAHGVDSLAKGEHPTFDQAKLKTIVENSIEDPHFKSHLPEAEPQPIREFQEPFKEHKLSPQSVTEPIEVSKVEIIKTVDEHASQRFSELEKASPELASEVHAATHEEVSFSQLVKEKNLYKVALDCFLRTGGH